MSTTPGRRTYSGSRLSWRNLIAATMAVLGAVLGTASLFGEWSSVVLSGGETVPAWTIMALDPFGFIYAIALYALVVIVLATVFGHDPAGIKDMRVTGLVVSGLLMILVSVVATMLAGQLLEFGDHSAAGQVQVLGWGIYAAFGGLIALAAALVLHSPVGRPEASAVGEEPASRATA